MMKRALVLTNEAAGHSLRRRLPPPPRVAAPVDDDKDVKLFLMSFAAFFTAMYSFIA